MKYEYAVKSNNVYLIDTKMFGFEHYNTAYLVKGKELALVDTGLPNQLETVLDQIKGHGFSVSDISHIFITHEHHDHCGNVAPLVKMNPKIRVHTHPIAEDLLTDPAKRDVNMARSGVPTQQIARFGKMQPLPREKLEFYKDGDVFDLGDGEKLRVEFAPAHLPGAVIIFEEKYNGLFINDLTGNYFADADAFIMLTPHHTNVILAQKIVKKLLTMKIKTLFLGHFGIMDNPKHVMKGAVDFIQSLLDIGVQCVKEGKPELIESRVREFRLKEAEKLIGIRSPEMIEFTKTELIAHQSSAFAKYFLASGYAAKAK
jgi:glyoxylase-like metal-dependent hydrolase (beta-lactamase superfamily II)